MKKNKNLLAALLLTASLGAVFFAASYKYYNLEKEACFSSLTDSAVQLSSRIHENMIHCMEHLGIMAGMLAGEENRSLSEQARLLSSFEHNEMTRRLELLFPDNTLLLSDGRLIDAGDVLSFDAIAARSAHVTGREPDVLDSGQMVVRGCMPITRKGRTAAILISVIEPDSLPGLYHTDAFGGNTQIYLIDSDTGDILVDTAHGKLTNIYAADDKALKNDGSIAVLAADISAGREETHVFSSHTNGVNYYSCYTPANVNRWVVMLTVPQATAFERLMQVTLVSYCLAGVIIAIFAVYFIWMLLSVRRDRYEKESRLSRVNYMFDVEKILFDALVKPGQTEKALRRIGEAASAQKTALIIFDPEETVQKYVWSRGDVPDASGGVLTAEELNEIAALSKDSPHLLSYHPEKLAGQYPFLAACCKRLEIKSIMLVPIEGRDKKLSGLLAACNMTHRWDDCALLECVSLSFSMFIHNLYVYRTIRSMGTVDSLTGLLNRNSYHAATLALAKDAPASLACIYIDVNGLHDVNNCLGHEAGDQMLQFIAGEIKKQFCGQAYRVGGDEFVILCAGLTESEICARLDAVLRATEKEHYYLSAGVEWRDKDFDISALIRAADEKMQQNKRRFYENQGDVRKIREMNHQLEEMITEKKDADAFLSVIASSFMGVYFVNLTSDSVRHVYIPPYFEEMLQRSDGRFSKALALYAKEHVAEEYSQDFRGFCDYDTLESQLGNNLVPELIYRKPGGAWLKLRIFKFKKYTDQDRETLWIFETIEAPGSGKA